MELESLQNHSKGDHLEIRPLGRMIAWTNGHSAVIYDGYLVLLNDDKIAEGHGP